ncbi:MAG TPA: TIGR02996 domain-containing protein [Urbifossiella sp.]|nr:TIGR02996 domain-containing protein [Urbifossiella sp.]
MTDEEALRAAVLAHPDDDTPRLVYADWCDDAGDTDRAAFIRAQIAAARAEPYSPGVREAENRATPYLIQQVDYWHESGEPWYNHPGYGRGFIEEVGVPIEEFTSRFAAWCEREPVRRLRLHNHVAIPFETDGLEAILTSPLLARVTELDAKDLRVYSSVEYDALVQSDGLTALSALRLTRQPVPPEWLMRFLAGPHLPALAVLDLSDIPNLGPALANGLTAAVHRRFTSLNFSGVRFLSGELQRVLASRALAGVEELRLGWSYPGPGPLTMLDLGWVMPWSRLRLLDMAGQRLGPDGVKEIVRKRDAAGLRWLGLARNVLGSAGAHLLAEAPHLHLYHLDVSDNGLTPDDLAALRVRFPEAVVIG